MQKQILLTQDLRDRVNAKIEAAYKACEKHYKQKFKRPDVHYDLRNTNAGEAWRNRNLIRLNLTFLVENADDFLNRTPGHEVAHLVAHAVYDSKPMNGKKVRPHGKEWKEVMGVIAQEPSVKHSFSIASLDIHKKPRRRNMMTTKAKIDQLLKQIAKLEANDREYVIDMVKDMRDE